MIGELAVLRCMCLGNQQMLMEKVTREARIRGAMS
jgi:hypothetical protein